MGTATQRAEVAEVSKLRQRIPRVANPVSYAQRPHVHGKFLYVGDEKYWVKGVTYGTFAPDAAGDQFPARNVVDHDFALIASNGLNTVRTYTPPPVWLLDAAQRHGLRVMVGLPWEQHINFLDGRANDIVKRVSAAVAACECHPAVLCFAVGNEIPPSIVRWYGAKRVANFLRRLYDAVKAVDRAALVTYVNYPTTEYLDLPFLDLLCFNVYLESQDKLSAYLARLQNLAGDRPLLMAEIGLDSQRNGEIKQADSLAWQVRTAFAAGCAGAFVFAWTDEWYRGGFNIEDWDFGLTTRDRRPKPALTTVRHAFTEVPFPAHTRWPRVSVVVCSYNGSRTLRDTLEALERLDYPNFEVIVVNDGSTDNTASIAAEYDVRLISTENRGLSNARNTGWQEATGEIIAYIDDDAYPDPHWLQYLAWTFMTTDYVGVGGPNIAPAGDGEIADCVANAPGGPVHVLVSDTEAEHIPGCNMAFRRSALADIGGFDPRYRAAGDDVDLCWRLMERGGKIGFHAAAMDWHHRRNSLKMYWKQQQGYGKAEALLEEKWPEKYNTAGHLTWAGRLYGKGLTERVMPTRWRVYHGTWNSALFQSVYQPAASTWVSLPLMPEWYLIIAALAGLSLMGLLWSPLLWAAPLLAIAVAAPIVQAARSASRARFTSNPRTWQQKLKLYAITAYLHLLQPMARLNGRLKHGLSPWRQRTGTASGRGLPLPREVTAWSETWRASETWLGEIETALREAKVPIRRGDDFASWDLEVRGGLLGKARLVMAIEEHGSGKQLARFRVWPSWSTLQLATLGVLAVLTTAAAVDSAWAAATLLAILTAVIGAIAVRAAMAAMAAVLQPLSSRILR